VRALYRVNPGEFGMMLRMGAAICVALIVVAYGSCSMARSSDQNRNKLNVIATGVAIMGVEVQPLSAGLGRETASAEPYDPTAWTAAIQTNPISKPSLK
jgi:hypothetical protein